MTGLSRWFKDRVLQFFFWREHNDFMAFDKRVMSICTLIGQYERDRTMLENDPEDGRSVRRPAKGLQFVGSIVLSCSR